LLDYDARGGSKTGPGAGKLKERLYANELVSGLKSNPTNGVYSFGWRTSSGTTLFSPTVSTFSARLQRAGSDRSAGLASPEFQITTETTVVEQPYDIRGALWQDINLDLSFEEGLAATPTNYGRLLEPGIMNSAMSDGMRAVLLTPLGNSPP